MKNSAADHQLFYILDPAHMVKLVRNTVGEYGVILDSDGGRISWQYIVELHTLQEKKGLHLGNRLGRKHVYFQNAKMKVKLASQTLSKAVADAIAYARDTLGLQQFAGSEATENFIRV